MDLDESFMDEEDKREVKQTNNSLVLLLLLVLRWGLSLSDSIYFFTFLGSTMVLPLLLLDQVASE